MGTKRGRTYLQRFLTDKAGDYSEIQAGLARTQYECIPMPPCSAWEWVEGYGAMSADPAKVHGDGRRPAAKWNSGSRNACPPTPWKGS